MQESMNGTQLQAGQVAYAPVTDVAGQTRERRVLIVEVGPDRVLAKCPELGSDYGTVVINPSSTFVVREA